MLSPEAPPDDEKHDDDDDNDKDDDDWRAKSARSDRSASARDVSSRGVSGRGVSRGAPKSTGGKIYGSLAPEAPVNAVGTVRKPKRAVPTLPGAAAPAGAPGVAPPPSARVALPPPLARGRLDARCVDECVCTSKCNCFLFFLFR